MSFIVFFFFFSLSLIVTEHLQLPRSFNKCCQVTGFGTIVLFADHQAGMVDAFFRLLDKDFSKNVVYKRPHLCAGIAFDSRQKFNDSILPTEPAERRIERIDLVRRIDPVRVRRYPLALLQNFVLVKFRKFLATVRAFHTGRLRQMITVLVFIPHNIIPMQSVQNATVRAWHLIFSLVPSNVPCVQAFDCGYRP